MQNEWVRAALFALAYVVVYALCRWLSNKLDSKKLKEVINLLPEAMLFAEKMGGDASTKLDNAISYIQDCVKNVSKSTIATAIESGIVISKNINKENDTMKTSVKEEQVTVNKRLMSIELDENEVMMLSSVIASSGRTADVRELYDRLLSFNTTEKQL